MQNAEYYDADKYMNGVNGRKHKEKHEEIIGHRGQPVRDFCIPFKQFVYEKYDTGQNRQPEPDAIIASIVQAITFSTDRCEKGAGEQKQCIGEAEPQIKCAACA